MISTKDEIIEALNKDFNKQVIIKRRISRISNKNITLLFQRLSSSFKDLFYLSKPDRYFSFLAMGKLKTEFNINLELQAESNLQLIPEIDFPLYVGYQKFSNSESSGLWSDFETTNWYIPQFLLVRKEANYFLIKNFIDNKLHCNEELISETPINLGNRNEFENDSTIVTGHDDWNNQVNKYLQYINNRIVEKIVLSRQIVRKQKSFSSDFSLQTLENKYPQCFVYGIKSNQSFFFGASPEKLFSINNSRLETEAIAGSAPRGTSSKEDEVLENHLLSNPKELREHFNVVKFINEQLSDFASDILTTPKISLKKLNNIQHLQTKISANLITGINILDIIKALHPTPAVCGYPREEAFKLINETEEFDRGLYSGVVGWFDENMNGEFTVAIRSALVKENYLYAFAGCGIVEGSDADTEFNETELKLKPILSLFENENTSK